MSGYRIEEGRFGTWDCGKRIVYAPNGERVYTWEPTDPPQLTPEKWVAATQRAEELKRIEAGLQCPECFGPYTQARWSALTMQRESNKYECQSCGCEWSRRVSLTG